MNWFAPPCVAALPVVVSLCHAQQHASSRAVLRRRTYLVKPGRRPGSHLQVEASGPRNAASVQQRRAGRSRRGEVAEGCACGAEGRSKGLICLRVTWMGDTGGKSARRPGTHLQVEASGPRNAASVQQRRAGRFRGSLLRSVACSRRAVPYFAPARRGGAGNVAQRRCWWVASRFMGLVFVFSRYSSMGI